MPARSGYSRRLKQRSRRCLKASFAPSRTRLTILTLRCWRPSWRSFSKPDTLAISGKLLGIPHWQSKNKTNGESNLIMKTFHLILANSLVAFVTNNFVWFAVTFWVYLETKSVIATSVMAGIFTLTIAFSGFFLGSLVDRFPKKRVMLLSSVVSLVLYAIAGFIFVMTPYEVFRDASSVQLWVFIVLALVGAIGGNL